MRSLVFIHLAYHYRQIHYAAPQTLLHICSVRLLIIIKSKHEQNNKRNKCRAVCQEGGPYAKSLCFILLFTALYVVFRAISSSVCHKIYVKKNFSAF